MASIAGSEYKYRPRPNRPWGHPKGPFGGLNRTFPAPYFPGSALNVDARHYARAPAIECRLINEKGRGQHLSWAIPGTTPPRGFNSKVFNAPGLRASPFALHERSAMLLHRTAVVSFVGAELVRATAEHDRDAAGLVHVLQPTARALPLLGRQHYRGWGNNCGGGAVGRLFRHIRVGPRGRWYRNAKGASDERGRTRTGMRADFALGRVSEVELVATRGAQKDGYKGDLRAQPHLPQSRHLFRLQNTSERFGIICGRD